MAALRKDEVRLAPVRRVSQAEFAHFAAVCKDAPHPSEALKAAALRFKARNR